jgi:hypothetical protein
VTDPARVAEIRAWVSEVVSPAPGATILVTELVCAEAGRPPLETAICILGERESRIVSVHRPLTDVTRADVVAAFDEPRPVRMVIMPGCIADQLDGAAWRGPDV